MAVPWESFPGLDLVEEEASPFPWVTIGEQLLLLLSVLAGFYRVGSCMFLHPQGCNNSDLYKQRKSASHLSGKDQPDPYQIGICFKPTNFKFATAMLLQGSLAFGLDMAGGAAMDC